MVIFNKKKKYEAINAQSKKEILTLIEGYIQQAHDISLASKFNSAKNMLANQGVTSSEQVATIDKTIVSFLVDLGNDLASGSIAVVEEKLDKVFEELNKRAPLCADNSAFRTKQEIKRDKEAEKAKKRLGVNTTVATAEDLYSPEELIKFMIIKASEQKSKMQQEKQELFNILDKDPRDSVATYSWMSLKVKMKENEDRIAMLQSEGNRTLLVNSIQRLTLEQKRMIVSRKIGDEQFDMIMSDYQKMVEARNADNVRTDEGMKIFFGSDIKGKNESMPIQEKQPAILNDPDFIAMKGGSTTNESFSSVGNAATDEVFGKIGQIVRELEKCDLMYSDKLDDVSEDLKDIDIQLKQLLEKRVTASASECLILDGQIDRLNVDRSNAKNAVQRYRQALATNTEKLSLARSLQVQHDLNEINRKMQSETDGVFTNFEDYAMALRDYVEKANSDLENIGTANTVANGVEIQMNTITGRNSYASSDFEIKDEDKYKALEMELGIRKA